MPIPRLILALCAAAVLLLPSASPAAAQSTPLTQTLGSGAWIWFSDPRAVYYDGRHRRSYAAWVSAQGHAMLGSYDHDTHVITPVTLARNVGYDDHASPGILLLPKGRLMVFYSSHAGKTIRYRTTSRPEDVTSIGRERRIPRAAQDKYGATYPTPMYVRGERRKIWVVWRGKGWQPMFATSTNGRTWSRPRTLIKETIPGSVDRPYVKMATDGNTIHFAFTDAHPGRRVTGIYYAAYRDGLFFDSGGQTIGSMRILPLTTHKASVVYDPYPRDVPDWKAGRPAWIYDIAVDREDRPVIVYDKIEAHTNHRYRYARLQRDGNWFDAELAGAGPYISATPGWYSAGISLDQDDPDTVYMSRPIDGQYEIERWHTDTGGWTWTKEQLTRNSRQPNLRPVSPRGLKTNDVLFWMRGEYPSYLKFRTSVWMMDLRP
jgi:hypothetical protein